MHVFAPAEATVDLHELFGVQLLGSAALVTVLRGDPASVYNDGRAINRNRVLTLKRSTDRNLAAFVTVKWVNNIKSIVSQAIDCLLAWNQDFL